MCEFNVYDVYGIQECLDSYLKLIQWLPAVDADEEVMKDERIAYAKHLISKGLAYPCFCSPEDLEEIRNNQEKAKERTGYYGKWT